MDFQIICQVTLTPESLPRLFRSQVNYLCRPPICLEERSRGCRRQADAESASGSELSRSRLTDERLAMTSSSPLRARPQIRRLFGCGTGAIRTQRRANSWCRNGSSSSTIRSIRANVRKSAIHLGLFQHGRLSRGCAAASRPVFGVTTSGGSGSISNTPAEVTRNRSLVPGSRRAAVRIAFGITTRPAASMVDAVVRILPLSTPSLGPLSDSESDVKHRSLPWAKARTDRRRPPGRHSSQQERNLKLAPRDEPCRILLVTTSHE